MIHEYQIQHSKTKTNVIKVSFYSLGICLDRLSYKTFLKKTAIMIFVDQRYNIYKYIDLRKNNKN